MRWDFIGISKFKRSKSHTIYISTRPFTFSLLVDNLSWKSRVFTCEKKLIFQKVTVPTSKIRLKTAFSDLFNGKRIYFGRYKIYFEPSLN